MHTKRCISRLAGCRGFSIWPIILRLTRVALAIAPVRMSMAFDGIGLLR